MPMLWQMQMHLDTHFNIIDKNLCTMVTSRLNAQPGDPEYDTCDIYARAKGTKQYALISEDVPFVDYLKAKGFDIIPIDYAMSAAGYGLKTYSIRTEEELTAALEDALTQDRPVLYDIKVLPGSMTPGYESWWRVGVAEVSEQPRVQAAYESLVEHVRETRKF